jgi:ABC-type glutathione transport system ATPase component
MNPALLEVEGLTVTAAVPGGTRSLVRDLSFRVEAGTALGMVGESGSGKTLSLLALVGLLPAGLKATARRACFAGQALLALPPAELQQVRGRGIAFVFQDSLSALNPVLTIHRQIAEVVRQQGVTGRRAIDAQVAERLAQVGLPDPVQRMRQYPHQLSGGMRQRVCIAMALASAPRLLVLDEPTTALDVTVQAGIVDLIARLQRETGLTLIWVTHDLPLLARIADAIVVMRRGELVEDSPAEQLFARPAHAYTRELLASARGHSPPSGAAGVSEPAP